MIYQISPRLILLRKGGTIHMRYSDHSTVCGLRLTSGIKYLMPDEDQKDAPICGSCTRITKLRSLHQKEE